MPVKTTNRELEKLALRTIAANKAGSQMLLGMLNDNYFGTEALKLVYRRIMAMVRSRNYVMSWEELITDTALPEATREALHNFERTVPPTIDNCKRLFKQLDTYRKLRVLFQTSKFIADEFQNQKLDPDELLLKAQEQLANGRSRTQENRLFHVGKGNNSAQIVRDILYGSETNSYLPTGFSTFDRVNRGIFRGSLFTIAATSGGGKSTLAQQLKNNFASYGAKVVMVGLEMNETEMMKRDLSRWSGVSMTEIIKGKDMLPADKRKIAAAYKQRAEFLRTRDTRESLYVPDEDVSIEDVFLRLKPFNYDVIIIDYISLLKDADGDDQWRKLQAISRFAKVYASNTNTIVVLLAQLSDEGAVRYSRGVQENSSNFWAWIYNERAKETGTIFVQQYKARNQKSFPFYLKEDFDHMTIRDMTDNEMQVLQNTAQQKPEADGKSIRTRQGNLPHQQRVTQRQRQVSDTDDYLKHRMAQRKNEQGYAKAA